MNSLWHRLLYDVDVAGVSTLVLTLVTMYYARATRKILDASVRQASAAERNVDLLLRERKAGLETLTDPFHAAIARGRDATVHWLSKARQGQAPFADADDLECEGLGDLISRSRWLFFPLSEALIRVDEQLLTAKTAISRSRTDPTLDAEEEVLAEVERLKLAWEDAEHVLDRWR